MDSTNQYLNVLLNVSNFISKNNRNDTCWCNSGEKYKNCHLNREKLKLMSIQEEQDNLKKIDKTLKLCLFSEFDSNCSSGIIKAHSISKSLFLSKISENDKVYTPTISSIKNSINVNEIHINKASIFNGFCNKHDTSLFSEFEQKKFTSADYQLFKLGYRSLCLEIFKKIKVIQKYNFYKNNADRGKPLFEQVRIQLSCNKEIEFNKNSLETLKKIQTKINDDLIHNTSYKMRHCLITLTTPQNILCSSMISPELNLDHKKLQELKETPDAKNIFLNSFIFYNTGYILLSWLTEDNEYGENFTNSIFSDPTKINHKLISLLFMYTENIFIKPSWWDRLDKEDRNHLQSLIEYVEDFDGSNNRTNDFKDYPQAISYSSHIFL